MSNFRRRPVRTKQPNFFAGDRPDLSPEDAKFAEGMARHLDQLFVNLITAPGSKFIAKQQKGAK